MTVDLPIAAALISSCQYDASCGERGGELAATEDGGAVCGNSTPIVLATTVQVDGSAG